MLNDGIATDAIAASDECDPSLKLYHSGKRVLCKVKWIRKIAKSCQ